MLRSTIGARGQTRQQQFGGRRCSGRATRISVPRFPFTGLVRGAARAPPPPAGAHRSPPRRRNLAVKHSGYSASRSKPCDPKSRQLTDVRDG
ncbi:hypothetical protein EVAR_94754_1 [Eumeta japonica]|uniref:Uncharacterized protein n=1 Tax=Eumeta variegata TaxID=151549 RepID=A0A4C1UVQ5_EUMVA|nr:hypothetical protein EVAR_94754_1 [Eumeta japonica]